MKELRYLRAAVEGATSVGLVTMLYDRLVADLRRAIVAMRQADVEARCAQVKHALLVLQQLEGSLDHEQGGEAAINLAAFYSYGRAKVMESQIKGDPQLLERLILHFVDVRDAWRQVDPANTAPAEPAPKAAAAAAGAGASLLSCTV
jgi:flagellar protein FliS